MHECESSDVGSGGIAHSTSLWNLFFGGTQRAVGPGSSQQAFYDKKKMVTNLYYNPAVIMIFHLYLGVCNFSYSMYAALQMF